MDASHSSAARCVLPLCGFAVENQEEPKQLLTLPNIHTWIFIFCKGSFKPSVLIPFEDRLFPGWACEMVDKKDDKSPEIVHLQGYQILTYTKLHILKYKHPLLILKDYATQHW